LTQTTRTCEWLADGLKFYGNEDSLVSEEVVINGDRFM